MRFLSCVCSCSSRRSESPSYREQRTKKVPPSSAADAGGSDASEDYLTPQLESYHTYNNMSSTLSYHEVKESSEYAPGRVSLLLRSSRSRWPRNPDPVTTSESESSGTLSPSISDDDCDSEFGSDFSSHNSGTARALPVSSPSFFDLQTRSQPSTAPPHGHHMRLPPSPCSHNPVSLFYSSPFVADNISDEPFTRAGSYHPHGDWVSSAHASSYIPPHAGPSVPHTFLHTPLVLSPHYVHTSPASAGSPGAAATCPLPPRASSLCRVESLSTLPLPPFDPSPCSSAFNSPIPSPRSLSPRNLTPRRISPRTFSPRHLSPRTSCTAPLPSQLVIYGAFDSTSECVVCWKSAKERGMPLHPLTSAMCHKPEKPLVCGLCMERHVNARVQSGATTVRCPCGCQTEWTDEVVRSVDPAAATELKQSRASLLYFSHRQPETSERRTPLAPFAPLPLPPALPMLPSPSPTSTDEPSPAAPVPGEDSTELPSSPQAPATSTETSSTVDPADATPDDESGILEPTPLRHIWRIPQCCTRCHVPTSFSSPLFNSYSSAQTRGGTQRCAACGGPCSHGVTARTYDSEQLSWGRGSDVASVWQSRSASSRAASSVGSIADM